MQAHTKYLYSSWEMSLNIRVKVRVDTNVDGLTDERKTRSLYHAMLKAGAAKIFICRFLLAAV